MTGRPPTSAHAFPTHFAMKLSSVRAFALIRRG
jgi:hypothetical protein